MKIRDSWRVTRGAWTVLIALLLVLPSLQGCKKKPVVEVEEVEAEEEVVEKKAVPTDRLLNFNNWNEPEYLDPGLISGSYDSNIVRNIFEGLVQHNPQDGMPEPALE